MDKRRRIESQLEKIDERLANAEEYLARGENVEGTAFLHFDDWQGRSGHPKWMVNFMIPATRRGRARKEKAFTRIVSQEREKPIVGRRRVPS